MIHIWYRLFQRFRPKRARTVRYLFSSTIGAALFLGATVLLSEDVSYVYLDTTTRTVAVGERISVAIAAVAQEPVNAAEVTLVYPEDGLRVQEIDRGQSVITIWTTEPTANSGEVSFGGGTYRRGFIGSHQLLAIDFVAEKVGTHEIALEEFQLLAGDGEGSPVATAASNRERLRIFVYDENNPPTEVSLAGSSLADLDQDGRVGLRDVSQFLAAWNSGDRIYDLNQDGRMSFTDFSILLARTIID